MLQQAAGACTDAWSPLGCSRPPLGCSFLRHFQLTQHNTSHPHLSRPTQQSCFPQPAGFLERFAVKYLDRVCSTFLRRHTHGCIAGGENFSKGSVGALEVCWALIKAVCPWGGAQAPQQMMNSALQLKYLHLKGSSYNADQIDWLLVLLTFTLPCSMDYKLEQLGPSLLILCYHSEFKTSWHVLSLLLSHAHLQIVLEMSQHLDGTA